MPTVRSPFANDLVQKFHDAKERANSKGEQHSSGSELWGEPDWSILDDRRGELPDFPTEIFPPPLQDWLHRAARGAGVMPEHVAVPLLGVASSLIGTARRIRPSRSWSEPATLWTTVVAFSGDRKTPGLNVTLRALDLIEKNNRIAVQQARLAHETRVQKAKEVAKKWKEDREKALTGQPARDPPAMPIEAIDPGDFIAPRLYTNDPTIEKLGLLLGVRTRGMMLIRDELSGLFANMRRYSSGSDRPFWLEAWNGGRHIVERLSRSVTIEHLLIGVIGGFQPDKLARAFDGDEDGMYARFLYAWPKVPPYQPLTNDASEVEPEIQNLLTALIRLPAESDDGTFLSRDIRLSEQAVELFEGLRREIDRVKHGLDGRERHWFVKGETQVLRLAGTLALMAWAVSLGSDQTGGFERITADLEPSVVEAEHVAAAIKVWHEYFWPHARAALRQIGLNERHANARRVLRWIKAHERPEISVKDVRRDALAHCLDKEQTIALLKGLEQASWLREINSKTGTRGQPPRRWAVNPALYAQNADNAENSFTE